MVGGAVYRKAKAQGLGREVPMAGLCRTSATSLQSQKHSFFRTHCLPKRARRLRDCRQTVTFIGLRALISHNSLGHQRYFDGTPITRLLEWPRWRAVRPICAGVWRSRLVGGLVSASIAGFFPCRWFMARTSVHRTSNTSYRVGMLSCLRGWATRSLGPTRGSIRRRSLHSPNA